MVSYDTNKSSPPLIQRKWENPFGIIKNQNKKKKMFKLFKEKFHQFSERVRMKKNCVFHRFELYMEFTRRINKTGKVFLLTFLSPALCSRQFFLCRVLWPFSSLICRRLRIDLIRISSLPSLSFLIPSHPLSKLRR